MIGPMVSDKYTNVEFGKIEIGKFAQIGAGTVILPKVIIAEGSVIGAMSLVKKNTEKWKIYGGTPIKFLKNREMKIIELSKMVLSED